MLETSFKKKKTCFTRCRVRWDPTLPPLCLGQDFGRPGESDWDWEDFLWRSGWFTYYPLYIIIPIIDTISRDIWRSLLYQCWVKSISPVENVENYLFASKDMGHGHYLVYSSKSSFFERCIIVFQGLVYKQMLSLFEECIIVFQATVQFPRIKMSRIRLSIVNFGCSSYHDGCRWEPWITGSFQPILKNTSCYKSWEVNLILRL
jgi:hypothetical protein